jgi:methionyl aminopeptidase
MVYHHKTKSASKAEMRPGMAFTIEPILMMSNDYQNVMWKDGWTVQAPGVPSCQWEHIILITEEGRDILTLREGETSPLSSKQ